MFAQWREAEIHTADLGLGYRSADWSEDICDYLTEFPTDVVAWLAGREPIGDVTGSLPELGPWP